MASMKKKIRTIILGLVLAISGLAAGSVAATAISNHSQALETPNQSSKTKTVSEMSERERDVAMDVRTLPNGKTIGRKPVKADYKIEDLPDFIGVKYGGGKVGYVRKTDAFAEYFQSPPASAAEAEQRMRQKVEQGPQTIPVFADDGETVIGEKAIGNGQFAEELADGTIITYDFDKGTITTESPTGTKSVENVRD